MITVGLDLSLTSTGIARVGDYEPTTRTIPTKNDRPLGERLDVIKNAVWSACLNVDLVLIELLYKGARGSEATFQVHGLVAWMLWRDDVPHRYIPPATLKTFALGKGTGTKTEMTLAAARRLGYQGHSDDEADALWLAHLGAHLVGQPAVDLPATHLRALDKLRKGAAA